MRGNIREGKRRKNIVGKREDEGKRREERKHLGKEGEDEGKQKRREEKKETLWEREKMTGGGKKKGNIG